jgi:surfactin synthase thioesterase subunit
MTWLPVEPSRDAPLRLFCFPHAGAGAGAYRPWSATLGRAGIDVCPVQPPGREGRFPEAPYDAVGPLVDDLAPVLEPYLDRPYALFGHSMGALIAFELAHRLRGIAAPVHLFVSGRIAPQLRDPRPRMYDLPDAQLIARLRALGGIPSGLLDARELIAMQLPLLRADLALNERYEYRPVPPLAVPLSAYGGVSDPKVSADELRAWHEQTTGLFRVQLLAGGHFFVQTAQPVLLRSLTAALYHAADELRGRTRPAHRAVGADSRLAG